MNWGAFTLLICIFAFESVQAIENVSWNYFDQDAWKAVDAWDCNGMRQSPINIVTDNVEMGDNLIDLVLTNFDLNYNGDYLNTGYSVEFTPHEGRRHNAIFQNHLGTYQLQRFVFHWGSSDADGSEHTIDGTKYSGELHFVTKRADRNGNENDAYAVLGVLLSSDDSVNLTQSQNLTLMELSHYIPTEFDSERNVHGVALADLLPDDRSYYYYQGSFTTPACREVVQWFLLMNPVSLPPDFLNSLRTTVEREDGRILDMNFRMIQDLNNRPVMMHTESGDGGGGGGNDDDSAATKVIGKGLFIFVAVIACLLYY